MIENTYALFPSNGKKQFIFLSEGSQGTIAKFIFFSLMPTNEWNLGFGDWKNGDISDSVVTNNYDALKVMRTASRDRVTKFNDYAAHGVGEYWIIHPKKRTIEQYILTEDNTYELLKKVGIKDYISSEVMVDFDIPVAAVFEGKVNLETLKAILFKS